MNVSLWTTSFIWATNHSVRVDISSSNYPRFAPNPNNGLPVNATNGAQLVASNTVWAGGAYPSAIYLPVVDAATQLPEVPLLETVLAAAEPRLGAERTAKIIEKFDLFLERLPQVAAGDAAGQH